MEPLPFFDMFRGVCGGNGRAQKIFGPQENAISRSVNAAVSTITNNLFVVGGQSYSQPEEGSPAKSITPALTDISTHADHVKKSDEVLDTQRLWNLFVALRHIYHLN